MDALVGRSSTSELLRVVGENPGVLVDDPKKEFRAFRVTAASPLGPKRGTGRGGFIDSVLTAVDGFYASVLQELRPWAAKAPQLPKGGRTAAEEAGIDVTPPPGDLEEPIRDEELVAPVPPETEEPVAVSDGVSAASELMADAEDPDDPVGTGTVEVSADGESATPTEAEIVSWDEAQAPRHRAVGRRFRRLRCPATGGSQIGADSL